MVDGGMSPRPASMGQPELPAWLESLRAGEPSTSPTNSAANFSSADFVDEDSLPSWMRAQRNETRDNTGANPSISLRPSSLPDPSTDGEHQSGTGFSARSLLDEQALPSWMQEGQQSGPVSAQEKIVASSLVQSENMPDWMKSLHSDQASFHSEIGGSPVSPTSPSRSSQRPSPTSQTPAFPPQRSAGGSASDLQPSTSSGVLPAQSGFSARDLVDPQSLPSWMAQQGERPAQSSPVSQPGPSHNTAQSGFSARDLVDPQSLPSWMAQQGERPAQSSPVSQPGPSRNPGQLAQGQTFPASSLLDANALPNWLRENGLEGKTQEQPGSLANQSFQAPSATPPVSTFGGNIPASSLVDANAAPEWMRQIGNQQPKTGFGAQSEPVLPFVPGTPQPNIYAGPPRVENIRVPNRPRREINPNENSEVAANVFSSMLGVASSTPYYPASPPQPQSSYQQPGLLENPVQPNMGHPISQAGMPPSGSANYAGPGMAAIPNTPGMAPNTPQGYTPGNSYGSSYQGGMSSSQMGNSPSASMPYAANLAESPFGQRVDNTANEQKKAKKRGVFGAILEWLTH
jgi:hypothetical protein